MTFDEIGERFEVSGGRVQQVVQRCLRQLRHGIRFTDVGLRGPVARDLAAQEAARELKAEAARQAATAWLAAALAWRAGGPAGTGCTPRPLDGSQVHPSPTPGVERIRWIYGSPTTSPENPGRITLTATADGLTLATTTVETQPRLPRPSAP